MNQYNNVLAHSIKEKFAKFTIAIPKTIGGNLLETQGNTLRTKLPPVNFTSLSRRHNNDTSHIEKKRPVTTMAKVIPATACEAEIIKGQNTLFMLSS